MRHKNLWWLLAALLIAAIYYPGLFGPFLLDDDPSINPAKIQVFTIPEFLNTTLSNTSGPLGRPLAVATFILNDYFWGPEPFSYKVTNVCIHLFIGGLLFFWLRQLCRHLRVSDLIPLLASMLWMIHPMQVSTALYPVQRMTQLSSLFMVLGCIGYTSARMRQLAGQKNLLILYGSALFCFPLAILGKENGALLALYYLCLEFFIFRFDFKSKNQKTIILSFLMIFSIIPLIGAVGYIVVHWDRYLGRYHTQLFSFESRLLTQPVVLLFYLKELIIPRLSELGLFLDDFSIYKTFGIIPGLALGAHVCLLSFLFYKPYKNPLLHFSIAWFYASHVIESTVLPLEMAFEHRNYLASLGVFVSIAQLFSMKDRLKAIRSSVLWGCLVVYITLLGYLTFLRVQTWSSMGLFLSMEVDEHPNSSRAHVFWANYLINHKLHEEALKHLSQVETLSPHSLGAKIHQLMIYCPHPNPPPALIERVLKGADRDIINAYGLSAITAFTTTKLQNKCPSVSDKTFFNIMQLASENLNLSEQKEWRSTVYRNRAIAHMILKQYDEAMIWLDKAFALHPKQYLSLFYKFDYQTMTHRFKEAQETIDRLKEMYLKTHSHTLFETIPLLEMRLKETKEYTAKTLQAPFKLE